MAVKSDDPEKVDTLLADIQVRLDLLTRMSNGAFTRHHSRQLEHIRGSLRHITAKLPPKRSKLGRPEDERKAVKGKEAYEMKAGNEEYTWDHVAHILGITKYRGGRFQILDWARDYAIKSGRPWPVIHSKHSRLKA